MSVLADAIAAVKKVLLLEERIQNQGRKLEELSTIVVDIDKRLARLEGFVAGASAARQGIDRSLPVQPTTRIGSRRKSDQATLFP